MANGHGVETPANKFATALATLGVAIRLHAEVNARRIDSSIYKREVSVVTAGQGLHLPGHPSGTQQDLERGTFNLVLIALSASALTADETLDEVFGKLSSDKEPSREGVRVMVNQLRNAFAHNPWRPRWLVYQKYRKVYPVVLGDGTRFSFDATHLDGDGVKPEHVGGFEFWVKLLQHCEGLVA